MRRLLWLSPLFLVPLVQADGIGELNARSPAEFFGKVSMDGSGLQLYHQSFEDGSLSGTLYAGSLVDRHRHFDCEFRPYEHHHYILNVTADQKPVIFQVASHGLVVVEYGSRTEFPVALGAAAGAQDGSAPVARLGPNPYPIATTQESAPSGSPLAAYARSFPLQDFVFLPSSTFRGTTDTTVILETGNLTYAQGTQSRSLSSMTTNEEVSCPEPLPITPPPRRHPLYHSIRVELKTGFVDANQGFADPLLEFYEGKRNPEDPLGEQRDQPYYDDKPPRGYWFKDQGDGLADAYRSYGLPSTMLAATSPMARAEGVSRLHEAQGEVLEGATPQRLDKEDVDLSGNLALRPIRQADGGRRMVISVEGDLFQAETNAPAGFPDWQPYAAGAAGGALLLGLGVYAWPGLKWWFARALFVPLYARLKKEEILENPLRDDILAAVQDEPGISASELGRRIECGWGTLVYHLTVLERMSLVSSTREGRHKRFFAQGRINYSDKGAVALLANPAARTILDAIRGAPGLIQKDLSERLGLSPGTIAWHVERQATEGLVVKEEDGRTVRYFPSDRLLELTQRLAA